MSEQEKEVQKETKQQPTKKSCKGKTTATVIFIALLLLVAGLGYGYYQLSRVNISLANMVNSLQQQVNASGAQISQIQDDIHGVQNGVQKSQELSQQQEQMIAGWEKAQLGDLSRWHVAEARYLTNLANYNLQFTRNVAVAMELLTQANAILHNVKNPNVKNIIDAISKDLDTLRQQPQVNIQEVYTNLVAIKHNLETLPTPEAPLQVSEEDESAKLRRYEDAPWYKKQWHRTMSAIRKIVIVKYNDNKQMPLVMPSEKVFLYQNLHLQMETIIWALLNNRPVIYKAGLGQMIDWVQNYFVQDAPQTKQIITQLKALQDQSIQTPATNINATLQLFDQYLARTDTKKAKVA